MSTIQINVDHGRADSDDIERAKEAAEESIAKSGFTASEAATAYARETGEDAWAPTYDRLTPAAQAWHRAQQLLISL